MGRPGVFSLCDRKAADPRQDRAWLCATNFRVRPGGRTHAAQVFELAIQKQPNVALGYLYAGLAWRSAHDETKAVGYLERAVALDPQMEQPYHVLLDIYSEAGNREMVRRTFERYHQAFPNKIDAQIGLRETKGGL